MLCHAGHGGGVNSFSTETVRIKNRHTLFLGHPKDLCKPLARVRLLIFFLFLFPSSCNHIGFDGSDISTVNGCSDSLQLSTLELLDLTNQNMKYLNQYNNGSILCFLFSTNDNSVTLLASSKLRCSLVSQQRLVYIYIVKDL